jgi:hypothetical protein
VADALAAELAAIRERLAACKGGLSSDLCVYFASGEDVPRLLAAVEAALEVHAPTALHRPSEADGPRICRACVDPADDTLFAPWPCPTVQAITRALLGEEKPNG